MQQKKPNKKRGKKNEKNWQITDNSNGDFDGRRICMRMRQVRRRHSGTGRQRKQRSSGPGSRSTRYGASAGSPKPFRPYVKFSMAMRIPFFSITGILS